MKLLYYIPAYGKPNLNIKFEILEHNINYISDQIEQSIDLCINFYSPSQEIIKNLKKNKKINKLYVYEKKGVLTELFLTNPNNSKIKDYDYILFILDDVKIININIRKMIEIKNNNKFEILSPKIIKSTHSFMNNFSEGISINNFLEVYFYYLILIIFINFYLYIQLKINGCGE